MSWVDPRAMRRAHVLAAMEAATGAGVAVEDPTADELLAAAERAGMPWERVLRYVYARRPVAGYSAAGFEEYAKLWEDVAAVKP